MALNFKRLAVLRPTNASEQNLYTVTSGKQIVGVLHACNQTASNRSIRVAVTDTGASSSAASEDWIEYSTAVSANTAHKTTIEGLDGVGSIRVRVDSGSTVSFVLMGTEKS